LIRIVQNAILPTTLILPIAASAACRKDTPFQPEQDFQHARLQKSNATKRQQSIGRRRLQLSKSPSKTRPAVSA
jgi:hypothetical protein